MKWHGGSNRRDGSRTLTWIRETCVSDSACSFDSKSSSEALIVRARRNPGTSGKNCILARSCCAIFGLMASLLIGCDRLDMYDQPRYEALEASNFFGDGLSARPRIEGTIPRGGLRDDLPFYTGKDGTQLVTRIPDAAYRAIYDSQRQRFKQDFEQVPAVELRQSLLERGRQRFDIYCSVCHGRTGEGDGMIVQRGFRRPPSYHSDRLRQAAVGHFYDVITDGFGAMAGYASRIDPADRWAIAAYIRALQLSENARLDDAPQDQRNQLTNEPTEAPTQDQSQEDLR